MDLNFSEESILSIYHPNAYEYFQYCSDLKRMVQDLRDNKVRFDRYSFKLFMPFSPQLCKRSTVDECVELMGFKEFWVETKLDGERIQMHFERGRFGWWSRNGKDYSYLYGSSGDSGSLGPHIKQSISAES
jgi:DNA ligase-4